MISSVIFLPPATHDIRKVYDWYETQKAGLGKEFSTFVLKQVEELQKNMIIHRVFFNNVRYVTLKKFPYSIFYFIDEDDTRIVIVAILANKQDSLGIIKGR